MTRLWTRCDSCQRCEWNTKLQAANLKCKGGATVTIYTPKVVRFQQDHCNDEISGDDEAPTPAPAGILRGGGSSRSASPKGRDRGGRGGVGNKGGKGANGNGQARKLLLQAAELAEDPSLRKIINSTASTAGQLDAAPINMSPVDALKKADGTAKHAEHLHDQAVSNVVRLRNNLGAAEEKENKLAKELATAIEAKKTAAAACAKAEGVSQLPEDSPGRRGKLFTIEWDDFLEI